MGKATMGANLRVSDSIKSQFNDQTIDTILTLRKDLHRYPELSFQEVNTSQRLVEELEKLSPLSINRITRR